MNNIQAAVIQMVSGTDAAHNINSMRRLVRQAAEQGANWVLLPEYWPIMGKKDTDKLAIAEPFGSGLMQDALRAAAQENGVTLFGGTIPLQSPEPNKVLNTMLSFAPNGSLLSVYHKVHLFGYSGLGERYAESDTITAGAELPKLCADGINIAQGVCYDLRFPEFFRAQLPFEVLLLPAAFTYTTGKAHWQTLLCARAIENQCYLLAAAQGGQHQNGRRTFGHSMIINPWGEVLACLPEDEGVAVASLDGTLLNSVRNKLPALKHKVF
ncbi:carbon-nitrogen hydrolase family protein [Stenoxybacter acetivorans]|uniref:carbon-nitrogen hydrolase family protein n=1 Tax=Stenoxybacter acetivorans TaxID=422441 RepID=UPI00056CEA41|nr:carbon-nitrogen hydrolase family protein [Stenoxybacter acetivorans]